MMRAAALLGVALLLAGCAKGGPELASKEVHIGHDCQPDQNPVLVDKDQGVTFVAVDKNDTVEISKKDDGGDAWFPGLGCWHWTPQAKKFEIKPGKSVQTCGIQPGKSGTQAPYRWTYSISINGGASGCPNDPDICIRPGCTSTR